MEWGPNPRVMSVASNEAVNVCRKTLLNHRLRDGYVIIQVRAATLGIEAWRACSAQFNENKHYSTTCVCRV